MIQTETQPKHLTYAAKIIEKIGELIDEEIDINELEEDDNLTQFIHALSNVATCHLYNGLTGDNLNILDFNHVSNKLCFQYLKK